MLWNLNSYALEAIKFKPQKTGIFKDIWLNNIFF